MNEMFPFRKPLNSELMKKSQEMFALLVLKHCEPERYASLITADAPDLQTPDKSIGIEVTYAVSQDVAKINGEFVKYTHGKDTPQDKAECERRIIQHGGSIDRIVVRDSDFIDILSFPVTDSQEEIQVLENAIRNKMKKVPAYKQRGFDNLGLFLMPDSPPIPYETSKLLSRFDDAQEGYAEKYGFLYFCHPFALLFYDCKTKEHRITKIDKEDYEEMGKCARIQVEQMYGGNGAVTKPE